MSAKPETAVSPPPYGTRCSRPDSVTCPFPEELGGAGGGIADAVQLLGAAGAHARPQRTGRWLATGVCRIALPKGCSYNDGRAAHEGARHAIGRRHARMPERGPPPTIGLVDQRVSFGWTGGTPAGRPSAAEPTSPTSPRDSAIFDGVPVTARADAPDEVTEQTFWGAHRAGAGRVDGRRRPVPSRR